MSVFIGAVHKIIRRIKIKYVVHLPLFLQYTHRKGETDVAELHELIRKIENPDLRAQIQEAANNSL